MNTKQDFKYYVKDAQSIARLYFVKYKAILKQFEFEDIEQHVRIGIWEAYKRYTPEKGKFFSYASWWINWSVKEYIMHNCDIYSLYTRIKRGILKPNFFTKSIVEKIEKGKPIGKNIDVNFSSFNSIIDGYNILSFHQNDFNEFCSLLTSENESEIDNSIDFKNVKKALRKLIDTQRINENQARRFMSIFVYKTTINSFSKIENNALVCECRKIIKLLKEELNVCTKKK